jgi:hypothetical protein
MSLINDMLQDLDRDMVPKKPVLPSGLATKKADAATSPRRFILPGLAVVAVIYAAIFEFNLFGLVPEKKKPVIEIPEPIALNSKWLHVKPGETSAEVVIETVPVSVITEEVAAQETVADSVVNDQVAQPAAAPVTIADVNSSDTSTVTPLLEAATRALAANQLTTPAGNNAYEFFKSVLVIDPQNKDALAGIESIRQRYIWWLQQALDQDSISAAQAYAQKAKSVGVDDATLALYADRLNQPAATAAEIPAAETSAHASITPAKIASDAEVAERLRTVGLRAEAEALRLIAQARATPQTAVALADLYAERQARGELRYLADLLADKTQPAYAYVAAQLWVLDRQEKRAADALASVEFDGLAERQRQRLLAGLQQKAGNYGAAMALYADLVSVSPESVSDWLGLAVSADRSKLLDTALDAYEKVLMLRHPDPRVMQFARQRQQDLSLSMINR